MKILKEVVVSLNRLKLTTNKKVQKQRENYSRGIRMKALLGRGHHKERPKERKKKSKGEKRIEKMKVASSKF